MMGEDQGRLTRESELEHILGYRNRISRDELWNPGFLKIAIDFNEKTF